MFGKPSYSGIQCEKVALLFLALWRFMLMFMLMFTVGYIVIATFQLSVYVLYLTAGNAKNEVVAK